VLDLIVRDPVLRRLVRMAASHRLMLALAAAAMALLAGAQVGVLQLVKILVDEGLVARDPGSISRLPLLILGLAAVQGVATFASAYSLQRISQTILFDLRERMFARLLHWPSPAFEATPSGMLITRFVNQANSAMASAAEVFTTALRDSLTVLGVLAYLLWQNWKLTLVALVLIPATAGVVAIFSRRLRRLNRATQLLLGEMTRSVQEAIDGQRVIKVYGGYDYEARRFRHVNARIKGFMMRAQVAWSAGTPLTQLLASLALAVIVWLALGLGSTGGVTPGVFVALAGGMFALMAPLKHLANLNGPLQRVLAAGESVFEMADSAAEEDRGARDLGRAVGAIELRGVCFSYAGASRPALDRIDLVIRPGEMIALVGPSGAGKTTLINLLPRFLGPTAGEILIDGVAASELTLASLRRQFALVSQDVVLFDDTIAANIAYGAARNATVEQVRAAAEAAYLVPFIDSLPQGLATPIGEHAMKLSGGQRQRLSIARAILKNAPLLLLDEATSALDSESERFIQASLERLMSGRTTLVVAHRLSTIERADRIVALDGGRVVEVGPHRELLARGGLYANLHRIQFAAVEESA